MALEPLDHLNGRFKVKPCLLADRIGLVNVDNIRNKASHNEFTAHTDDVPGRGKTVISSSFLSLCGRDEGKCTETVAELVTIEMFELTSSDERQLNEFVKVGENVVFSVHD